MPWRNIGRTTMYLPSGKIVKPGDTFSEKDAAGLNLRALELGRIAEFVEPPKPKPKSKGKK